MSEFIGKLFLHLLLNQTLSRIHFNISSINNVVDVVNSSKKGRGVSHEIKRGMNIIALSS